MREEKFDFFDEVRKRNIPCILYLPKKIKSDVNLVVFGPGYSTQEDLKTEGFPYNNYTFLAKYFTEKSYAFLSIQHDLIGDTDGLETLDPKAIQAKVREHLWIRGAKNIQFCLSYFKKNCPELNIEKFIIAGHSNGGDISKYFANNHPELISYCIVFDGRRCPVKENLDVKFLMFEATDTSTDVGVLPDEGPITHHKRENVEWVIVKPKGAMHISYTDKINNKAETELYNPKLRNKICSIIDWYLDNF